MPITLSNLWKKVYDEPHTIFTLGGKVAFLELCVKHHHKIEIDKKYEYEKENEPVYSGVDTFRAWMDGEIGTQGPLVVVQSSVNSLISQNKKLRDRQDPSGTHSAWTNPMYLLKPGDDASYTEDIEKKEFELCKGNVSELPPPGSKTYTENWGLLNIPAWITGTTAAGPEISDEEVAAIKADLRELTQSEDAAWGNIVVISQAIGEVTEKRQQLINWHGEYMISPNREKNLGDIWEKKEELHTLLRIRLQIQRLEADNKRLTSSGQKGTRQKPEKVEPKTTLELINKGGI